MRLFERFRAFSLIKIFAKHTKPFTKMKKQFLTFLAILSFTFVNLHAQQRRVHHLVMFKFKAEINFETPSFIEAEKLSFLLPEKINEIKSFECGRNFSDRSVAYAYGLVVEFDSKADLMQYIQHEYHKKVVQAWKEIALGYCCLLN